VEWCECESGFLADELRTAALELIRWGDGPGEDTEEGAELRRAFRRELNELLVWHEDSLGTLGEIDETIVLEGEENDEL
jgi:hypothetical protein